MKEEKPFHRRGAEDTEKKLFALRGLAVKKTFKWKRPNYEVISEVNMEKKRVHVLISGRVQGVFFRAYTRDTAVREGVQGWVRNVPDGRVEAVFEGDRDRVDRMVAWCRVGSPLGHVDGVEEWEEPYSGEFREFEIRYGR
jgi:acylphosphatase